MQGFAVASEELFMIAGVLDDRPQRGREIPYLMVSQCIVYIGRITLSDFF
jgi:hypothetical protein